MNCQDLQTILLETPTPEAPEAREHLESCADCRRFAELQSRLLAEPPAIPPPGVDRAVLGVAAFRLARCRRNRFRRRLLAVAAGVVVVFAWLAAMNRAGDQPEERIIAMVPAPAEAPESIWADGKLAAALRGIEEQATLLSTPVGTDADESEIPSLNELDNDLLDLELDFYFERAVLGSVEPRANG